MSIEKNTFVYSPVLVRKLIIKDAYGDTLMIEEREGGGVYVTSGLATVVEGPDLDTLIAALQGVRA